MKTTSKMKMMMKMNIEIMDKIYIYVTGLHTMWPSVSTSYFCATVVVTLHPGTITEQASRSCLDISYPN